MPQNPRKSNSMINNIPFFYKPSRSHDINSILLKKKKKIESNDRLFYANIRQQSYVTDTEEDSWGSCIHIKIMKFFSKYVELRE